MIKNTVSFGKGGGSLTYSYFLPKSMYINIIKCLGGAGAIAPFFRCKQVKKLRKLLTGRRAGVIWTGQCPKERIFFRGCYPLLASSTPLQS